MMSTIKKKFLQTSCGQLAYRQYTGRSDLPGLVFLGGFASSMAGTKASFLLEEAQRQDRSCVVFDYFGHGASDGAFQDGTISLWLQNACDVLQQLTKGPQIVIGSSMGGWLMLLLHQFFPGRIVRLVGIAPAPGFTEDMWNYCLDDEERQRLQKEGVIEKVMGEETYTLSWDLIADGRTHFLAEGLAITCPIVLLHSTADAVVPWSVSAEILKTVRAPLMQLTLVQGGDHRMNRPEDLEKLSWLVNCSCLGAGFSET